MSKEETKLEIFKNEEFGEIRTIVISDKPYFCANDVANVLGYSNPRKATGDHCKGVTKCDTPTSSGVQSMSYIPEGDLYRLIVRSKLPNAEKFETWVMDEVLPTIRKTGGYINSSELLMNTYFSDLPDEQKILVKGLVVSIEEKQKKIVALDNENALLSQRVLEWADRPLINSLVRAYAKSVGGDFGKAWNGFKKEILYKYSINLNSRITNYLNTTGKKTKPKTLDMLDDSEIPNALSTIVSMCKENEVDISEILNNKAS